MHNIVIIINLYSAILSFCSISVNELETILYTCKLKEYLNGAVSLLLQPRYNRTVQIIIIIIIIINKKNS